MQHPITPEVLNKAMTFPEYLELTRAIVAGSNPTGMYANPSTFRYTRSNLERMNRVLQNTAINQKLYNQLSELKEEWIWLVLSEPWCGDASWGTPALYLIAIVAGDKIDFRILLRDENPEIMKNYQTKGSDSIPKLVCLRKKDFKELGSWGPRPAALHELVLQWKNQPGLDYRESVRQLHAWYEADNSKSILDEITGLVKQWKAID